MSKECGCGGNCGDKCRCKKSGKDQKVSLEAGKQGFLKKKR